MGDADKNLTRFNAGGRLQAAGVSYKDETARTRGACMNAAALSV